MPTEDLGYCDRCEYEFEDNRQINYLHDSTNPYCDDCYEQELEEARERESEYGNESTGIYSYSYKPNTMFYNSNGTVSDRHRPVNGVYELMMGIELETELVDGDYIHNGAQYINSVSDNLIYLKEDCSISHGFEIVSHPMTLNYLQNHAKRYEQSLDFLRKHGYRAWKTSTCGLHIHVSKKSFVDAKHEMKFLYFIFRNKKTLVKFVGRQSGYSKFDMDSFVGFRPDWTEGSKPTIMEVVKGVRKNGDYVPGAYERNLAVNRSNNDTHELRIFRPSLRFTTVLAYAEFVHCLFSYAQHITAHDAMKNNGLTSFAPLLDYAKTQGDLYQNFITRAINRNVLKAETEGE